MGISLFAREALKGAAHVGLVSAVASELESRGYDEHNAPQRNLCTYFPRWESDRDVEALCYVLGQVGAAWQQDPWLVFHHAGILESGDLEDALGDMILGCQGDGISLDDSYAEPVLAALEKLNTFGLKPKAARAQPDVRSEDDWHTLACEYITWYFAERGEDEPVYEGD